jgi:hypothetical protein
MEIYPQDNEMSDGMSIPETYKSFKMSARWDTILSKNVWTPIEKTVTSVSNPVIFKGVGFDLDKSNKYVFPILKASALT